MTKRDALQSLHSVIHLLPASRQRFANDLLDQAVARGDLSVEQWKWVVKLTQIATQAAPVVAAQAAEGGFESIVELLRNAATGRERLPNFRVLTEDRTEVRLKLAGPTSRLPGSVNLTLAGTSDEQGREIWLGRITAEGEFQPSRKCHDDVLPALRAFQADPAAAAKAFSVATSACCFCTTPLTDPRSVHVGYGPICAGKWNLPWGELACEAVEAA